jgi:hypothetical protein
MAPSRTPAFALIGLIPGGEDRQVETASEGRSSASGLVSS